MPVELIINADDFGLSSGINRGIIEGHHSGIATSCSLMINIADPSDIDMLRDEPGLGVGIHINLTRGKPMARCNLGALLNNAGEFHIRHHDEFDIVDEEHIHREIRAQVEVALATGLPNIDHLDTHHHAQRHRKVFNAVKEIACAKGLACRASDAWMVAELRDAGVWCNDHFIGGFFGGENIGVENLLDIINRLDDGVNELMCHPGYISDDIKLHSGYMKERPIELRTLTAPSVLDSISRNGVRLRKFGARRIECI